MVQRMDDWDVEGRKRRKEEKRGEKGKGREEIWVLRRVGSGA